MDKRDLDFANDIKKAAEQRYSGGPWLLLILIMMAIGSFVYWASVSSLEQGAVGTGRVIPSSQTQLVENLEAGIVDEILVNEGDVVTAGQAIIRLENTGQSARLSELEKRERELSAELFRLQAEIDLKKEFEFDDNNNRYSEKIIRDQKTIFIAGLNRLEQNLQIRRFQKIQKVQSLAEAQANIRKQERALELSNRELKLTRNLFKKKAIPELEFITAKRLAQELESNLEIVKASVSRIEAEISEMDAAIDAEKSNYIITALERYTLVSSDLTAVVERIKDAREKVRQTELRSPVGGVINQLNVAATGEVILPGSTVAEITPLDDRLLIETQIRPQDIAFIRPGQTARIRLSAYDYTKYGSFAGKVERIGADTVVDAENRSFFRVIVSTEDTRSLPGDIKILPGMVATVNVLTGKRTILELILKPVIRIRDQALRS